MAGREEKIVPYLDDQLGVRSLAIALYCSPLLCYICRCFPLVWAVCLWAFPQAAIIIILLSPLYLVFLLLMLIYIWYLPWYSVSFLPWGSWVRWLLALLYAAILALSGGEIGHNKPTYCMNLTMNMATIQMHSLLEFRWKLTINWAMVQAQSPLESQNVKNFCLNALTVCWRA